MSEHTTDAPAAHRYQMPTVRELPRRRDPDGEGAEPVPRSRVELESRLSGAVADSG
jgi:hypothetical protein